MIRNFFHLTLRNELELLVVRRNFLFFQRRGVKSREKLGGEKCRKGEIYVTNFGKEINNVNPSAGFLFGWPVLGLNFNYLHNLISLNATIHG